MIRRRSLDRELRITLHGQFLSRKTYSVPRYAFGLHSTMTLNHQGREHCHRFPASWPHRAWLLSSGPSSSSLGSGMGTFCTSACLAALIFCTFSMADNILWSFSECVLRASLCSMCRWNASSALSPSSIKSLSWTKSNSRE